jgi:hypothetical protein
MAIIEAAANTLIREHEAIRASFKWLDTSVNNSILLSDTPKCSPEYVKDLRVSVENLLALLDSLHYGIKEHLACDQKHFKCVAGTILTDQILQEHKQIQTDLDFIIMQTQLCICEEWREKEFVGYLSRAKDMIHRISLLVEKMTREEDTAITNLK